MIRWRRLLVSASAVTLLAGGTAAAGAIAAQAQAQTQVCTVGVVVCQDAWNGGPFDKTGVENSGNNVDFYIQFVSGRCDSTYTTTNNCPYSGVQAGHVIFQIVFAGSSGWTGYCAGDAYNNPGDADMSLDACNNPNTGYGGGYGTLFWGFGCGGSGSVYQSFHWPWGSIGGDYNTYGNEWYENTSDQLCMQQGPQFGVGGAPQSGASQKAETVPVLTPSS